MSTALPTDPADQPTTAIDRYLTAFENNTLDERTCGQRVRDLTIRLDQLTTRRDELADLTQTPPPAPSPQAIERVRRDLAHVIAHGTPGQRKALIETHIAKITIEGEELTPTFLIPTDYENDPTDTHSNGGPPVRTMRQVVSPVGIEPTTRGLKGPRDPSKTVPPRVSGEAPMQVGAGLAARR